ncbi:hypothetical protein VSDG_01989 [Cytospora chrysosperma]|uniref:Rhodopsin domain-containing protein n=1 Tax=Cytospora chrysosperma TaxID=252740 RepID=A0A423WEL1_CYTCH|nr:hypothetical protein VSDG_01989 [Valsa sordida]
MTIPLEHYLVKDATPVGLGDRATTLFVVFVVMLAVTWVSALLRAYVRICMIKNVAADDWWMLTSLQAIYTIYSGAALWGIVHGGTGKRTEELTLEEVHEGLFSWYICEVLYAPASVMVRTSVAIFLLRVASTPVHRWIIWANLGVVYIISIVFFFIVTFQCSPPRYFYDQIRGQQGSCVNLNIVPNVTIAHSAIGATSDLIFASLPIVMLWKVQLNKRTKLVIALLLSMGFVAGIVLLVRIPYVERLAITPDFLYETVPVATWSVLEPSLGIIAGCVATLRPLFHHLGFGGSTTQLYGEVTPLQGIAETIDRQSVVVPCP